MLRGEPTRKTVGNFARQGGLLQPGRWEPLDLDRSAGDSLRTDIGGVLNTSQECSVCV
jgi:hypothetical protein